jgi:hypothetical protein
MVMRLNAHNQILPVIASPPFTIIKIFDRDGSDLEELLCFG